MNLKSAEQRQNNQLKTINLMKRQCFISLRSIFCDWYLEITKIIYSSNDKIIINETKQITSLILSKILVMLHPIYLFLQNMFGIKQQISWRKGLKE